MRSCSVAFTLILGFVLTACNDGGEEAAGGSSPESGRDVIEAMVQAHEGSRYRSLTFVQRTVTYGPDGAPTDTSTWYEALAPGRLRIDVAPWRDGNGILYLDGLRYTIRGGQAVDSTRDINPLALLLADAFHQPVDRTATVLDSLGFELSAVREDRWEGEPVWVVGAPAGDTTSSQFWIEQERLLPVRIVDQLESGPLMDARIGGYRQTDSSWVESHIDIRVGGRLAQTEEYREIRVNPELPEGLFDPYHWEIAEPYWESDRTGASSPEEMGRVVRSPVGLRADRGSEADEASRSPGP